MPVFGLAGRTEIGASFFCFIEYKIRLFIKILCKF